MGHGRTTEERVQRTDSERGVLKLERQQRAEYPNAVFVSRKQWEKAGV